jgi:phosphoribosylglycinamide formyltransferase-1
MRKKVGVLISGRGSVALPLIEAARSPAYPAEIALVLSNQPAAPGIDLARAAGAPVLTIDHRPFGKDREAHERVMDAALREAGVEFIALAGYMRILTPFFVSAWSGRMINTHPSLLPAFPGLHTYQRALEAGVKLHGCSVHWVVDGVDEGPLIGQAAVPVLADDDEDALKARVLAVEQRLYPVCLAAAISGITNGPAADSVLANPRL